MSTLHVVLPNDIDDPASPSGGNVYDREVLKGLAALGWTAHEHPADGQWPDPTEAECGELAETLSALPDDAPVLVDGLVAAAAPDVLAAQARRLRLIVLVHMPLGGEGERRALAATRAVITTSAWTRDRFVEEHGLDARGIHVATPGVEPAPLAPGSPGGAAVICVAAVIPAKGHDVLAAAMASVTGLDCACIGSLQRDPGFVARLRRQIDDAGTAMRFTGPYRRAELDRAYAAADLLVLPSRGETYGMVVAEALAHGLPVIATAVGGVPEAIGHAPDGTVPGMLVPPDDPVALAAALCRWRDEPRLRAALRRSARSRRETLTGWAATAARISEVLRGVAA